MAFTSLLLLAAAAVVIVVVSGRLAAGLLGVRFLLPFAPSNAAASAILGTVVWTVGFGWLTEIGWPAPKIAAWLAAGHLCALAATWYRGGLSVLRPRGPLRWWLPLLAAVALAAFVPLLPVFRSGGFAIENDTYFYCAFADWLQGEGFGTPCRFDPDSPVTFIPSLWQETHSTFGATYPLALVQAASSATTSLAVFPAASALAAILVGAGVVLVARWVLRLSSARAGLAGAAFALLPGPVTWGYQNGFLQQTFGLSGLLFAIAVLTRCLRRREWGGSSACLVALTGAYMASVYMAMLPALAVALLLFLVLSCRRAWLRGERVRWLLFSVAMMALGLAIAQRDVLRVVRNLPQLVRAVPGWHIPFAPLDFLEFAVGSRVYAGPPTAAAAAGSLEMQAHTTPIYLGLLLLGLIRAIRRPRTWVALAVLALLGGSLAFYALVGRDPWTGEVGHTWNVLKLSQWAFPLVFLFQAWGADRIASAGKAPRMLLLACLIVLAAGWVRIDWVWSRELGLTMRNVIRTECPLDALPAIRSRLQSLPRGTLLLLNRNPGRQLWLGYYAALLAFPRPIVVDFTDNPHFAELASRAREHPYLDRFQTGGRAPILPIVHGLIPFAPEGVEDLGGGFKWLREPRPLVIRVRNPNGLEVDPRTGRSFFWMGEGRTEITLFSPTRGAVQVVLAVRPGPSKPETKRRTLVIHPPSGPAREVVLDSYPECRLRLDLDSSLTTIGVEVRDRPSVPSVGSDTRPLLLGVTDLSVEPE